MSPWQKSIDHLIGSLYIIINTAPLASQTLSNILARPTHIPTWLVGEVRYTPQRGVAHPPSGQRPISLEYQIYTPTIPFDTLVTGMGFDLFSFSFARLTTLWVGQ